MLAGLEHPVSVVRDRSGVPHVYARSDHDAFLVNGYLQAQDRFLEMDAAPFFSRRAADGTRPEVMGPGAFDEVLGTDLPFRSHHLLPPPRRPVLDPTRRRFIDPAPDLPGLSTDGGYDTVDFSQHEPRADSPDGFMYDGGASRRFSGDATPRGIRATEVIAGGESGEPTDPTFGSQLGVWLTNEAHPTLAGRALPESAASPELFMPSR